MNAERQFNYDLSPKLTLIDPTGRLMPVVGADRAGEAIAAADRLFGLGGSCRTRTVSDRESDEAAVLLYYASHNGKPRRSEIARAARVMGECDVTLPRHNGLSGDAARVSGRRSVVYPDRPGALTGVVPILVSTCVWFNRNRSTVGFPAKVPTGFSVSSDKGGTEVKQTLDFVIDDINPRLPGFSFT